MIIITFLIEVYPDEESNRVTKKQVLIDLHRVGWKKLMWRLQIAIRVI